MINRWTADLGASAWNCAKWGPSLRKLTNFSQQGTPDFPLECKKLISWLIVHTVKPKFHFEALHLVSLVRSRLPAVRLMCFRLLFTNVCCVVIQESLADAKVSERQQCVYMKAPSEEIEAQLKTTLEPNIKSIGKPIAMAIFVYPGRLSAAILDFWHSKVAPLGRPTPKTPSRTQHHVSMLHRVYSRRYAGSSIWK